MIDRFGLPIWSIKTEAKNVGGGGGIRTHARLFRSQRFSKPPPWTGLGDSSKSEYMISNKSREC